MNWKKILIKAGVYTALAGVAWYLAPAFLFGESAAIILGAKLGIGALYALGLYDAFKDLFKDAPPKTNVPEVKTPVPQKQKEQKENQQERDILAAGRPQKNFGIHVPKLMAKWRFKKTQNKQNYRDAA